MSRHWCFIFSGLGAHERLEKWLPVSVKFIGNISTSQLYDYSTPLDVETKWFKDNILQCNDCVLIIVSLFSKYYINILKLKVFIFGYKAFYEIISIHPSIHPTFYHLLTQSICLPIYHQFIYIIPTHLMYQPTSIHPSIHPSSKLFCSKIVLFLVWAK